MAGNELPPVVARLVADTAEFIAGFREAQAAVASFAMSTIEARDLTAELGATMREAGISAVADADAVRGVRDATAESVGSMESLGAVSGETSAALAEVSVSSEAATVSQRALAESLGVTTAASGVYVDANGRMRDANGRFVASAEAAGTAAKKEGESATGAAGGLLSMKNIAVAAAVATVGVAVAGVKMATDFQTATVRLVTSAGEVQSNLKMVQDDILQMSGQVGVSSMELANAMYYVESAGFQGAKGLQVLTAAAQGAKAEGADTTTVVKALTDVLKDYQMPASQAALVTSQMIAAVAHGKTSLEDFSKAFASIIPAASAAGISFTDAASALAEMTNHGFTAQRASQNLAQALRSLLNPTKPMLAAFDEFGISTDVLKAKLAGPNGLTTAMQYMSDAASKAGNEGTPAFAAALKRLMGTAPGANAALSVVGANMKDTTSTIEAMTHATADSQGQVKGFAEVQQNFGQTMSRVKDAAAALVTKLGLELLPIVTRGGQIFAGFLGSVTHAVTGMSTSIGAFVSGVNLQPVVSMFQAFTHVILGEVVPIVKDAAKILGPVMVVAFGLLIGAARAAISVVGALLAPLKGLFDFAASHREAFQALAIAIGTIVLGLKAWNAITVVMIAAQKAWAALMVISKVAVVAYTAAAEGATIATKAWAAAQAVLDLLNEVNPVVLIITIIIALIAAFIYLWQTSAGFRKFWEGLWAAIKDAAEAVGRWFAGPFVAFFENIGKSIGGFVSDVVKWFKDLPDNIVKFFKDLPREVGFALGYLVGTVVKSARDTGKAFLNAITTGFKDTINFFKDLSKKILDAIKDPQQWLNTPGMKVIRGLVDGIVTGFKDTVTFLKNLGPNIINAIKDPQQWLNSPGMKVIRGLGDGIVSGAKDVWHWFTTTLPASIGGFFKDVSKWLWNAGKDLVMGLIHGIESQASQAWNAVKSFAGGIVSGFKSAMGIGSPSKVMADEVGQYISSGIAQGMLNGISHVHGAVAQIRSTLTNAAYGTLGAGGGGSLGTYAGLSTGGAGGGTLVIQNNIAGTVVGETQLSDVLRVQVLRYNQKNPTNGLSLFGRGNT